MFHSLFSQVARTLIKDGNEWGIIVKDEDPLLPGILTKKVQLLVGWIALQVALQVEELVN